MGVPSLLSAPFTTYTNPHNVTRSQRETAAHFILPDRSGMWFS